MIEIYPVIKPIIVVIICIISMLIMNAVVGRVRKQRDLLQKNFDRVLSKLNETNDEFRLVQSELEKNIRTMEEATSKVEEAASKAELLKEEASKQKQRALEYFGLLERLEKQRDEWKGMWFTQVREHQEGQAMLERALMSVRGRFVQSLQMVNAYRQEKKLEPLTKAKDFDREASLIGTAEAYGVRMKELEAKAPVDIDTAVEVLKIEGNS
jgi:phage-related minor tail protein